MNNPKVLGVLVGVLSFIIVWRSLDMRVFTQCSEYYCMVGVTFFKLF